MAVPSVPLTPHQPSTSYKFPKRSFGKNRVVERSFQASWFHKWKWLHYNELDDLVFCHVCMKANAEGKLKCRALEPSFVTRGFSNWKDATMLFRKHEESGCHKDAMQVIVTIPKHTSDVGEMLSHTLIVEKKENRLCLRKLLSSIRFLARQGCAIRGDQNESDSNFTQLLKLREEDNPKLSQWVKRKSSKFTSADMQNEMLEVMALKVLRDIALCLQNATFFTIMVDETVDSSNREQAVLVFRWIDDSLEVHEDFIGLYMVPSIDADTLVKIIKDSLMRMNLSLAKCRGQCYDGASNMSGAKKGVAKQLSDIEKRAIYTHCYGHSLNLAIGDSIKQSKVMRDALDTTFIISQLLKYSPKRDTHFEILKKELAPDTPGLRVLCPTRWTVRAQSLESVLKNYAVLQELWVECEDFVKEADARARVNGVSAQMKSFDFLFGVALGELLLMHSDNLSKTLQHKHLSAAEGQASADLSVKTLEKIRDDKSFDLFWAKVSVLIQKFDVNDPSLPRKRKCPRRYEEGNAEAEFSVSVKDYYRRQYFEALDLVIAGIKQRFDQPGYKIYKHLQEVLLKSATGNFEHCKGDFEFIVSFYGSDFTASLLKIQLELFHTLFAEKVKGQGIDISSTTICDIIECIKTVSLAQKSMISEVITLVKLLLVMPASNATSERSFSALRRVKTYLRSTMTQLRLNNLMLLHIHKERTDSLNLDEIANDFIDRKETRLALFGKFTL